MTPPGGGGGREEIESSKFKGETLEDGLHEAIGSSNMLHECTLEVSQYDGEGERTSKFRIVCTTSAG